MKKVLLSLLLVLSCALASLPAFGQGLVAPIRITTWPEASWPATGLTLSYTTGSVYRGSAASAITAGTLTLTTSEGTCTAAAIQGGTDACNYVYDPGSGAALATSTTYATAVAPGDTLLYLCTTSAGGNITGCLDATLVLPLSAAGTRPTGQIGAATPAAGQVGQLITSSVAFASAASITTATPTSPAGLQVSLPAGDWDVHAVVTIQGSSATFTAAAQSQSLNINTGTGCSTPARTATGNETYGSPPPTATAPGSFSMVTVPVQVNVSATTTACAIAYTTFSAGTATLSGSIMARRRD